MSICVQLSIKEDTSTPMKAKKQTAEAINEEQIRFLLRYAVMAPSSHNTQPWKFRIEGNKIHVFADFSRWLTIADPARRELFISVGCALENLWLAARTFRYQGSITYFPDPASVEWVATVELVKVPDLHDQESLDLFSYVINRHTYYHTFQTQAIPASVQQQLQPWAYLNEVSLFLTDEISRRQEIEELVTQADIQQFANPAYREELGYWIGQSAFGTPWLMAKMGQWVVTHFNVGKSQAKKDANLVVNAPLIGILYTQQNNYESQVKVGQVFERLCLGCTKLGMGVQPISQPLEIPELKVVLASILPDPGMYPQHMFGIGYPTTKEKSTSRRSLEEVMI